MSNKYMARMYTGQPSSYGGGGGGSDLFGIQFHRQQKLLQQQHQQELEKLREAEGLEEKEATKESELKKGESSFNAAVDILKAQGIIPNDTNIKSYDDATTKQRLAIAQVENDIENVRVQNQLQTLKSKPGQDTMTQANLDVLAKPTLDANVLRGQAQGLSKIDYAPNTGVSYNPGGDFTKPPVQGQGPTQKITMTGGIIDPKTGQLIGARPVETYDKTTFPPVARIDLGQGVPPIQTKPDVMNNGLSTLNPSINPNAAAILSGAIAGGANQPNIQPPNASNQVMTKPQSSGPPLMQMGPGPQVDWQRIMQFMKQFGSNQMSGPLSMMGAQ